MALGIEEVNDLPSDSERIKDDEIWVGHVGGMETEKFLQSVVEILKGKDLLENHDVHRRIKVKRK